MDEKPDVKRYKVSRDDKVKAVEQMANINAPVTTWKQMKKEIELGYMKK